LPIYENYRSETPVYFHYATGPKNYEISLFGLKLLATTVVGPLAATLPTSWQCFLLMVSWQLITVFGKKVKIVTGGLLCAQRRT